MAKIALLGHGVVGGGVAELLLESAAQLSQKVGEELSLAAILELRDFSDLPYGSLFVKDFALIEADPSIGIVIECIGGARVAYDFVRRSLLAGKSVVTSNKELVAEKGAELLQIAREQGVILYFEASVGGGTPVIRPMHQCLAANRIVEIAGIVNGTTNYILTKMSRDGESFERALQQAFDIGYAEQSDYSADIDGLDACRKICILSSLAYGEHLYPSSVYTRGIRDVTAEDIAAAAANGYAVKLIARSELLPGGKVSAGVSPTFVHRDNQLANVADVYNGIVVRGDVLGDVMFYGQGAGRRPTASAVVADVIDIVKNQKCPRAIYWRDSDGHNAVDFRERESAHYLLLQSAERAAELFPGATPMASPGAHAALRTSPMSGLALEAAVARAEAAGVAVIARMPILDR